jgi:hypothetical protein
VKFYIVTELFTVVSMDKVETEFSNIKVGDMVGIDSVEFCDNGEILFDVVKSKNGQRDYFHLNEVKTMIGKDQLEKTFSV